MNKILVVYKKSTYDSYSESPDQCTQEYMKLQNENVKRMKRSQETQERALEQVITELDKAGVSFEATYRGNLAGISGSDLVVAVGGDGTFLDVGHYIKDDTPVLGVNSDPKRSVGFFCGYVADNFMRAIQETDQEPKHVLNRLEITLDGKTIPELVLNDTLVAHEKAAAFTRYELEVEGTTERYGNSGLLVCTAAGSTAWVYQAGGEVLPLDSDQIEYLGRDRRSETPRFAEELKVTSLTRQGKISIDGEHIEYDFTLGSHICIRKGRPITVIGDLEANRARILKAESQ